MAERSVGLLTQVDRWLIPTESERLRFNEAEQRQRRARAWLAASLLGAACAAAAFDRASWWVPVIGVLVLALLYVRMPVHARGLHLLVLVMVVQLLVAIAISQTGGPRSAALCMLLVPPLALLPRFDHRALAVGISACGAISVAVLLAGDGAAPTAPTWLWWVHLMLATVGVLASTWSSTASERHARQRSQLDSLTGTFRREILYSDLAAAIEEVRQYAGRMCVLVVDVDGFKTVNDSEGHAAGDTVLRTIAHTISGVVVSHAGRTYRSGGDEFVIICRDLGPAEADRLAVDMSAAVAEAGTAVGRSLSISVGHVSVPAADSVTPDALIARADEAMYRVKRTKQ